MSTPDTPDSPLEAAAGAAGSDVVDAFDLLSNETRLAILLALWEAYDPHAERTAISFSTLYDRVSVRDSGTFTYHLNELVGHFVEETDQGYRLRKSGFKIVRAVIAGSGLTERSLQPTDIPRTCYHCGAGVQLSYEDERLYQICTNCEGHVGPGSSERAPAGTLLVYDNYSPAGLTDRTPGEVFVASTIEYHQDVALLIRGVCPECSGAVEESLHICESHDATQGELCSTCGTWNEVRVRYVCAVCKYTGTYPAWTAVFDHPAIVVFYFEHGFDMTFGLTDPEDCGRLWDLLRREQTLLSEDPVRLRVTVPFEDDAIRLTLDGNLDVVEVTESAD